MTRLSALSPYASTSTVGNNNLGGGPPGMGSVRGAAGGSINIGAGAAPMSQEDALAAQRYLQSISQALASQLGGGTGSASSNIGAGEGG